jgi:hypothetical protein
MANLDRYRMSVRYREMYGLSAMGFKPRETPLADLFPTADEVMLSMTACFWRLDESAALMYEVPGQRFEVVAEDRQLELALPNPNGEFVALIVDVLAHDGQEAQIMLEDIETTCEFVPAKLRDALAITEIPEDEYLDRLKESMRLLANELSR